MKINKKALLMLIILIGLMMAIFSILSGGFFKAIIILSQGGYGLLYSLILIFASEIVKSLRYYFLAKRNGYKLKLKNSIIVQLTGFFGGIITPANLGGIASGASVLASYTNISLGEALGYASIQSFYDGIIPALISLTISLYYLPESILAFLISIAIITIWIAAFNKRVKDSLILLTRKILRNKYSDNLEKEINLFQSSLKIIKKDLLLSFSLFLITIVSYLIQIISIFVLFLKFNFLTLFISLMFYYVMASFPTPGGEGGVEYGLSITLPMHIVIEWRTVYVISALLSGLILPISIKRMKNYDITKSIAFQSKDNNKVSS